METIILIGTGAYFVFSGMLLIALLRSATRTSADWSAYTLMVNVQLAESSHDADRAHGHVAADASPQAAADRQRLQITHGAPAQPG